MMQRHSDNINNLDGLCSIQNSLSTLSHQEFSGCSEENKINSSSNQKDIRRASVTRDLALVKQEQEEPDVLAKQYLPGATEG